MFAARDGAEPAPPGAQVRRPGRAARGIPFANSTLALVSALVVCAGCELLLAALPWGRQILPHRLRLSDPNLVDEPYLQEGTDVPYTTRPDYAGRWADGAGTITLDGMGFRTSAAHAGDRVGQVDILCMGDSFTFGYLVDDAETYPAYLGRLYEPQRAHVVNAGYCGGFSFDSAALRYRHALASLHPRVILYGVFPDNDLSDLGVWVGEDADGGPASLRTPNQVVNAFGYSVPILRESRLFVGLCQAWSRWRHRSQLDDTAQARWLRVSDAVRRFQRSAVASRSRLVFVILREPNLNFARYAAGNLGVSLESYSAEREAQIHRLKSTLDAESVEWRDDKALLEELRAALAAHDLPPLPGGLGPVAPSLLGRAAQGNWSPAVLTTSDGVHYSGLTNAYVAAWISAQLMTAGTEGPPLQLRPEWVER